MQVRKHRSWLYHLNIFNVEISAILEKILQKLKHGYTLQEITGTALFGLNVQNHWCGPLNCKEIP